MSSVNPVKRAYRTPELVEYGAVQDLTAGGSGVTSEWGLKDVAMGMDPPDLQCLELNMNPMNTSTPFC